MQNVSRRGMLKAAGWTVPAVTLVAASPAYASSNPTCPVVKVKAAPKVGRTSTKVKGKTVHTFTVDVRNIFLKGSITDVTVLVNGTALVLTSNLKDSRGKTYTGFKGQVPDAREFKVSIVTKCDNKVVWTGKAGHDC